VLDVDVFYSHHHHRFPFINHRTWDSGHIERRFRSHVNDHRFKKFHSPRGRERAARPGLHRPLTDRTVSPSKNSPDRFSGSYPSKARSERRYASPQPPPSEQEVRQPPSSRRRDHSMPKLKSDPSRYADSGPVKKRAESMPKVRPSRFRSHDSTPGVRTLPPRPDESMPKVRPLRFRSGESKAEVRSLPPRSVESMARVKPSVGPVPEAGRRTPPSGRSALARPGSTAGPSGGLTGPSGGLTGPSGGFMDRRSVSRPQPGVFGNAGGRGPAGR
jgi:hypothetical protein